MDDKFKVCCYLGEFCFGMVEGGVPAYVAVDMQHAVGVGCIEHDVSTVIQVDVVCPEFTGRDMQRGTGRNLIIL